MTDTINVNKDVPYVEANLLPMHIQYSGTANTEEYFSPSKKCEDIMGKDAQIAYFRGCKLVGTKLRLDKSFDGYLLNKSENLVATGNHDDNTANDTFDNMKSVNNYTSFARFSDIIMYGQDSLPDSDNQWALINEWKEIADIIHS